MAGKRRRNAGAEEGSGSSPSQSHSEQFSQGNQGGNIDQGAPATIASSQTTTANITSLTAPLPVPVTDPGQTLAAPSTIPASASSAAATEGSGAREPARRRQKKPRRPKDAPSPDWSARVRGRLTDAERCPQACDRCTEKKMRCDDEAGDCKNCQGRGVPCWLTDKNSKRTYRRGITPLLVEENARLWRLVGSMDAELNRLRALANAQRQERPTLESLQDPNYSQYGTLGNTYASPHAPIPPEQYQRQYSRVPFPATPGDMAPPPAQTASSYQQQSTFGMGGSIDNSGNIRLQPQPTNPMQMQSLYGIDPTMTGAGDRRGDQQHIYQYGPNRQSFQQYNNPLDPTSSYRELPAPTASGNNQARARMPWLLHIGGMGQGQTAPRMGTTTDPNHPTPSGSWDPENPPDAIFNPQRFTSMDPSPFIQQGASGTSSQHRPGTMNQQDAIFNPQRIRSMDPSPFVQHGSSGTSSQQPFGAMNQPQTQQHGTGSGSDWQAGSGNLSDTLYNPQRMSVMEPSTFTQHDSLLPTQSQWRGVTNLDMPPPLQMPQQGSSNAGNEEQQQQQQQQQGQYDPSSSGSYGQQQYQP